MPASFPEPAIRVQGTLYRALSPVWAAQPLSGEGARRYGGRFNPKGTAALYTSLSVMGAVREANQLGRPFEPVTLVSYAADIFPVFDSTDPAALEQWKVRFAVLAADDWRLMMAANGKSASQALAAKLVKAGYAAILVPSYARGAPEATRNLVLWRWGPTLPTRLTVIDTEARLASAK